VRLGFSGEETNQLLCFDHANVNGPYEDLRDDLLRSNIPTPDYAAVVIRAIDRCKARHSPKPGGIDVEVNALCASVESEIKARAKTPLTRELTAKETVCASVVLVAVVALAFVRLCSIM
jgi:hypothetical protein